MDEKILIMKKIINYLKDPRTLIIVVLLAFIVFMGYCGGCGDERPQVVYDTVYSEIVLPGDSFPVRDTIFQPKPYAVIKSDTLWKQADSAGIIMQYWNRMMYDIVLRDDTSMLVRIKTSVYKNTLQAVELISQNRRPWHISQTIVQPPDIIEERKFKMFVGLTVGGSADKLSLAPGVLFQYKSFLSGVNYEVFSKSVNVPLYYKLSVKSTKGKKK